MIKRRMFWKGPIVDHSLPAYTNDDPATIATIIITSATTADAAAVVAVCCY